MDSLVGANSRPHQSGALWADVKDHIIDFPVERTRNEVDAAKLNKILLKPEIARSRLFVSSPCLPLHRQCHGKSYRSSSIVSRITGSAAVPPKTVFTGVKLYKYPAQVSHFLPV
jgi:hypothetical protein